MDEGSNMHYKNKKDVEKIDKVNTFFKEVRVGDSWEEIECEYEIVNNCAIEKGGDYLAFVKEGAEIPDYVKTIGSRAFLNREIKSITFPKSVEVIEELGCADCDSLESVTLNEGLKKIGKMAFVRTKIKFLKIPKSVVEIEGGAFGDIELTVDPQNPKYEVRGNCLIEKETKKVINGMKNSVIPNDIKTIVAYAFAESSIESITIPESVEVVEEGAFLCWKLKRVELNEGLREIGGSAFLGTKLDRITIPSTVELIGVGAFEEIKFSIEEGNKKYEVKENCIIEKETQKVVIAGKDSKIPDDAKHIGERAFSMSSIKRLNLPKEIESVGKFGLSYIDKINKVSLNEGLKEIGSWAFSGLKIKSVVIPNSVKVMGGYVFGCCDKLKKIYCRAKSKPDGWDEMWNSEGSKDVWFKVVWGYTGK